MSAWNRTVGPGGRLIFRIPVRFKRNYGRLGRAKRRLTKSITSRVCVIIYVRYKFDVFERRTKIVVRYAPTTVPCVGRRP